MEVIHKLSRRDGHVICRFVYRYTTSPKDEDIRCLPVNFCQTLHTTYCKILTIKGKTTIDRVDDFADTRIRNAFRGGRNAKDELYEAILVRRVKSFRCYVHAMELLFLFSNTLPTS